MKWFERVKMAPKVSVYDKIKSHNLPVIIYGAANIAARVITDLRKHGIFPKLCVVDDKYFEKDREILNIKIDKISSLKNKDDYALVMGMCTRAHYNVYRKLQNEGYICYYTWQDPACKTNVSVEYIQENLEQFNETYQMLNDDYSKETFTEYLRSSVNHCIFSDKFAAECVDESKNAQYFPEFLLPLNFNGLYIDCGAFDGDSVKSYIEHKSRDVGEIIALEPNFDAYTKLKNYMSENKIKGEAICKCAWNKNGTLSFSADGMASKIGSHTDNFFQIEATTIDQLAKGKKVGFIKMDIEGSELNALYGAKETIVRDTPILAICAYHKREDLITIPQYIKSLKDNGYKFYLRHHSLKATELVFYAAPK